MIRPLSILLAAVMLVTGPGLPGLGLFARAFAGEPKAVEPTVVIKALEEYGVIKGSKDPLLSYLFDETKKELTPMGRILYDFVKIDPKERVKQFEGTLQTLREAGPATEEQSKAAELARKDVEQRFAEVFKLFESEEQGGVDASFKQNAQLSVSFDGAARKADPYKDLIQMDTKDGFSFMDREGVVIKMAKNMHCRHRDWPDDAEPMVMSVAKYETFEKERKEKGDFDRWACGAAAGVTVFNRQLQKQQRAMNQSMGRRGLEEGDSAPGGLNIDSCMKPIPETGRYNYEMLLYSYCLLRGDVQNADRAYKIDLMLRLSKMLGEQFQDGQYLEDHRNGNQLYNYLEKAAKKKKINEHDAICGRTVESVWDLALCKLEKRKGFVDESEKLVDAYQARIEGFKTRELITEGDIKSLQVDEAMVKKALTLGFIAAQRDQAVNQMEALNYEVLCKKDGEWKAVAPFDPCVKKDNVRVQPVPGDSPDSERLRKAIEEGPMSEAEKKDYMGKGQLIATRIQRLLLVFNNLEDNLKDASPLAPMTSLQAALSSTQNELAESGLDIRVFTTMPMLLQLGESQDTGGSGWTNWVERGERWAYYEGSKALNDLSKKWGGNWQAKYIASRDSMKEYMPMFKAVAGMISQGDFKGARAKMLSLAPEALRTNWSAEAGALSDTDPSRSKRIEAVLQKANSDITYLMKEHMLYDTFANVAVWSVGLAVAAPAMSAALTGVSRAAFSVAKATAHGGKIAKTISFGARVVGGVAEHTAIRLQSLSPHASRLRQQGVVARIAMATTVRGINAGMRIGAFSLVLAGGMSGGIGALTHYVDIPKFKMKTNSPYASGKEAFVESWKQGAHWATESWHPIILFAGLPSSSFEETFLAGATKSMAERGVLGNTAALGSWAKRGVTNFFSKSAAQAANPTNLVDDAMGWMMQRGGAWKGAASVVSMGDHIGKYMLISHGAGFVAEHASYRFNTVDGENIERKIKRAHAAGLAHMQYPYWLLMPVFSAKYGVQGQEQQKSVHGFDEYKTNNELHKIANASEGQQLTLTKGPKRPFFQQLFEFKIMGENPSEMKFTVSKDLKFKAIRAELINQVSGGKAPPHGSLKGLNPNEFFKISRQEKGMAGRLHLGDEVRDQAHLIFEEAILADSALAGKILKTQAGTNLGGFGRVRLNTQEEVASILYRSNAAGKKVNSGNLKAAEAILKPYLESERGVQKAAESYVQSLTKNKTPSMEFQKFLQGVLDKTTEWKGDPGAQKKTPYRTMVKEFRVEAQKQREAGKLGTEEASVLDNMFNYIEAIDKRFNYFNRAGTASKRAESGITAMRTEYADPTSHVDGTAPSKLVLSVMDDMIREVGKWGKTAEGKTGQFVADPANLKIVDGAFQNIVDTFKNRVSALKSDGKIVGTEVKVLEAAVRELESAPWILKDAAGGVLPSWRAAQFEGLMHFLTMISADGAEASNVIRTFLRMGTGTGKTLISYEGLLPIAEADAARLKLKGGTIFLTVQSNLESQARIEYRALRKLLPRMDIDTWEGFKSRIAQGKLEFKGGADDYWILGDEMDGAALQPALTIGEQTASISKHNSGYRLLQKIGDRVNNILGRGPRSMQKNLEFEIQRQKGVVDAIEAKGGNATELKASITRLTKLTQSLSNLEGQTFRPSLDKPQALSRARGMLKDLKTSKANAARSPGAVQKLEGLIKELETAQGTAQVRKSVLNLDGQMREVWQSKQGLSINRVGNRIQSLVKSQEGMLAGADAEIVSQFRKISQKITDTVSHRGLSSNQLRDLAKDARRGGRIADAEAMEGKAKRLDGEHKLAVEQFRDLFNEQTAVLNQTEKAHVGTVKTLKKAMKRATGARKEGIKAQIKVLEAGTEAAQKGLKANAEAIMKIAKEGGPGWQAEVKELVQRRQTIVEKAVAKQNPIYEIFRTMQKEMYSLYNNQARQTTVRQVLEGAPNRAAKNLREAGTNLVKDAVSVVRDARGKLAKVKVSGTPAEVKAAEAQVKKAETLLNDAWKQRRAWQTQAGDIVKRLLEQPKNAEHKVLYGKRDEALYKLNQAEKNLVSAKRSLAQGQAELKKAKGSGDKAFVDRVEGALKDVQADIAASEKGVKEWTAQSKKINAQLDGFEKSQIEAAKATFRSIQSEMGRLSKDYQARLAGFEGRGASNMRGRLTGLDRMWEPQIKRLDMTPETAVQILHKNLKGMVREKAWALMKAFLKDPFLPPEVRWKMFWNLAPSLLFPNGITGKGTSWVMTEYLNLARGYADNPANIRMDNISGKINVIHNGQWFDSMDTPTRRFWEVKYESDLTLPYEHKTMVTMNDFIRDNHNVRFVGFSGTAGKEFRDYMSKHKVTIGGVGSTGITDVPLEIYNSRAGSFKSVLEAIMRGKAHDAGMVEMSGWAKKALDKGTPAKTRAELVVKIRSKAGELGLKDLAASLDGLKPADASGMTKVLQGVAKGQADALVVLSLPDTRTVKSLRKFLLSKGVLTEKDIASVFSDTEFLSKNRPQAKVQEQMNLDRMRDGEIKLLMLDTRVGGRGLDLNYKGKRSQTFNGYRKYEMLILDPHLASEAHYVQAQGRIDLGRVPSGSIRNFKMVLDIQGAERDPIFRKMLATEPIFRQLRQDPRVIARAMKDGAVVPGWKHIQAEVESLKAEEALTGQKGFVVDRVESVVRDYMMQKQSTVEMDQLRSASVIQDAGIFDPLMYGLSPVRPGLR